MSQDFKDFVTIEDCLIKKSTGRAILVLIPNWKEPIWIPLSQVDNRSEIWKEGDEGTIIISGWIADRGGLR